MHHRLRVDEHLYLFGWHTEEPFCLHNLKALVHKGCRVDGYLRAHIPCGVAQCIGGLYVGQLVGRECAEWASRAGEQYFLNLVVALAGKALEYGAVLRVNRQYGHMVLHGQPAD